ncbi:hypothetical protein PCNPT3_11695 [Psychromonas sp. CNPT3]|uniref:hypothetical protein n=1 Tax=Psychromonas sp. CNPT3 TaxID=314282 RepID=UPI0002C1498F|nr:hypothetical protein [Psychromonas sp. CNPT3]AGH82275.1 hypothetical protein PCNPT3_11695 [Psychromonas sp. CNPT3]
MKIIYITSLLSKQGSSASIRNTSLINGLSKIGHDVTVLTIKYPQEVLDDYLINEIHENINVIEVDSGLISRYVPRLAKKSGFSQKRKASLLTEFKKMVKDVIFFPDVDAGWIKSSKKEFIKLNLEVFDIMISSSDTKTSHYVAKNIKKKFNNLKWIQIWGDPWYSDVNVMSSFKRIRIKYAEEKILKIADLVFYVSLPTQIEMSKKHPLIDMRYVPRGYLNNVDKISVDSIKSFKMVYTGLITGRNIKPIISAIEAFNSSNNIPIKLFFYGRVDLELVSQYEHIDFVEFKGQVSLHEVMYVYQWADILLLIGNDKVTTQIPGKLYDYFGTKCSILVLLEDLNNEVAKFIKATGRCNVFLNVKEEINLKSICNSSIDELFLEEYSPESIARNLITQVVSVL